jgi:hypothetical protein
VPSDVEELESQTNRIGSERMSLAASTAKENTQMNHQAVMQPTLDSREPESPAVAFERVLNTEALRRYYKSTQRRFKS